MKLRSFEEMLKECEPIGLNTDDKTLRVQMLNSRPFSFIVEAGHLEFDSLDEWIRLNMSSGALEQIYYGKTGYDYGLAEYFGFNEKDVLKAANAVPHIFTIYPDSFPPNQISRTDGYDNWIEYKSNNKEALIINIEKK